MSVVETKKLYEMILNNMETFKEVFANQERIEELFKKQMKQLREDLKQNEEYKPYFEILDNHEFLSTLAKVHNEYKDRFNKIAEEDYKEWEQDYIENNYPQYLPYMEDMKSFQDKVAAIVRETLNPKIMEELEENTEKYDELINDLNMQIGGLLQHLSVTSALTTRAFNFMHDIIQLLDLEKLDKYRQEKLNENNLSEK